MGRLMPLLLLVASAAAGKAEANPDAARPAAVLLKKDLLFMIIVFCVSLRNTLSVRLLLVLKDMH